MAHGTCKNWAQKIGNKGDFDLTECPGQVKKSEDEKPRSESTGSKLDSNRETRSYVEQVVCNLLNFK
jgi:hypothetical protein